MKRVTIKLVLAIILATAIAGEIYAADFVKSGKVLQLRFYDSAQGANVNWMTIEGFDSAGTCRNATSGELVLRIKDDERGKAIQSAAMAAFIANVPVEISLRETLKDSSGFCFVRLLRFVAE